VAAASAGSGVLWCGGGAVGGGSSELDLEFWILCCGVWVVGRNGV
jgi:hypothetical protein